MHYDEVVVSVFFFNFFDKVRTFGRGFVFRDTFSESELYVLEQFTSNL